MDACSHHLHTRLQTSRNCSLVSIGSDNLYGLCLYCHAGGVQHPHSTGLGVPPQRADRQLDMTGMPRKAPRPSGNMYTRVPIGGAIALLSRPSQFVVLWVQLRQYLACLDALAQFSLTLDDFAAHSKAQTGFNLRLDLSRKFTA